MYPKYRESMVKQWQMMDMCAEVLQLADQQEGAPPLLSAFAAARASHVVMECITEIGVRLIDILHLRDPGCYQDVIDVLAEAGIFSATLAAQLTEQFKMRQQLVREYAFFSVAAMQKNCFPPQLCYEAKAALGEALARLEKGEYF